MKNHYKFWIVFSLIIVFAAGVLGGILFQKHLLDKQMDKRGKIKGSTHFPTLEMMSQELDLTSAQQEKIKEIFKNNEERFKFLKDSIHERLSDIRLQLKKEIKNVLTEEQSLKFEAIIEKYISQRKKEMEKRKKRFKTYKKENCKGEKE